METGKRVAESQVVSTHLVMPQHTNTAGTLFGGQLLAWIDYCAAMVAQRHCERSCVTVSVDRVVFRRPIELGDQVTLYASLNYVGRSSMEVGVSVVVENPLKKRRQKATSAYLTFVAVDENGRPIPVPGLILETDSDRRRHENAKIRVEHRRELMGKLKRAEQGVDKPSDHDDFEMHDDTYA